MQTTDENVLHALWDFTKKRAISKFNRLEYPAINDWLDKMEMTAKYNFRTCKFHGYIPNASEL